MSEHAFASTKGTSQISDATVVFSDDEVNNLKALVRLSRLPPETYESKHRQFGVTSAWMREAKDKWGNSFDW